MLPASEIQLHRECGSSLERSCAYGTVCDTVGRCSEYIQPLPLLAIPPCRLGSKNQLHLFQFSIRWVFCLFVCFFVFLLLLLLLFSHAFLLLLLLFLFLLLLFLLLLLLYRSECSGEKKKQGTDSCFKQECIQDKMKIQ